MRHYFLFELHPAPDAPTDAGPPFALFTMTWDEDGPAAALAITPDPAAAAAEVVDLFFPDHPFTIPLTAD